jgi:molybdate transport system substrate-binding protein
MPKRAGFAGVVLVWAVALLALASLAGCGRAEPRPNAAATEDALVVFAAVSLRDAFTALGKQFERQHPEVRLSLHFAGTQELRAQLEHGAPADVFASADQLHMQQLLAKKQVVAPVVFARNEPVLVIANSAKSVVRSFADLPKAERIVVGTPELPIGRYTAQILERAAQRLGAEFRAGVDAKIVSRELNVRQVLAKVSLGEADAGIVYRTDSQAAGAGVSVVAIPAELNPIADYPIALVADAAHPKNARKWLALVASAAGQQQLRAAGFLAPGP